ncbi:oxidoreductase [Ferrimonas sp. SCSIO 43195]|uniref:oxidoreductase n=1 Tax=Ferrimonas sp. SCSIO 43195 TaxID=2822844 RepID=UPI0020759C5D|nr:oxidoreductase [Ferrimonas sp. SCSIO 43195]USD39478.1 SDR family NAD(P)-dependent oxidoreductase [Ferrimonas sp. SCSIO 43195]
MAKSNWDATRIPDQAGKVIIITGATSGLGKEAARVLAGKNATVVMAVRNTEKGERVANEIRSALPGANLQVRQLDLADLNSVVDFVDAFQKDHQQLDLLINNAGVMACPHALTKDGFELQMGTNHLGHFALTGRLMPLLKATAGARIVVTSSTAHKFGNIDFSDLNWQQRSYHSWKAYGASKLANLYFAYHLVDKLQGDVHAPRVTQAHPGWTSTELQRHTGGVSFLNRFFAQGADMGVLPTLRAAFDPEAKPGEFFGPANCFEMRGYPVRVKSTQLSHDRDKARQLWEQSEALTGVRY